MDPNTILVPSPRMECNVNTFIRISIQGCSFILISRPIPDNTRRFVSLPIPSFDSYRYWYWYLDIESYRYWWWKVYTNTRGYQVIPILIPELFWYQLNIMICRNKICKWGGPYQFEGKYLNIPNKHYGLSYQW